MTDHTATLTRDVTALLEDISGETIDASASQASFLELGFDSLLLGQVAQRIQKTYGVKLTFRQLLGAYPSIDALVTHLVSCGSGSDDCCISASDVAGRNELARLLKLSRTQPSHPRRVCCAFHWVGVRLKR